MTSERAAFDDAVTRIGVLAGGGLIRGFPVAVGECEHAWHAVREGQADVWPLICEVPPDKLVASAADWKSDSRSAPVADPEAALAALVKAKFAWDVEPYDPPRDEGDAAVLEEIRDDLVPERLAGRLTPWPGRPVESASALTEQSGTRWLCLITPCAGHDLPLLAPWLFNTPNWMGVPEQVRLGPREHEVVLRLWQRRFGAELMYLGGGGIELYVRRPPSDALTAATVAIEQHAYCDDLIQDTYAAASSVVPSRYWRFWWD